jgi:hypothetical protein
MDSDLTKTPQEAAVPATDSGISADLDAALRAAHATNSLTKPDALNTVLAEPNNFTVDSVDGNTSADTQPTSSQPITGENSTITQNTRATEAYQIPKRTEEPANADHIRALIEQLQIEPESLAKLMEKSSEKVARYVGDKNKGLDGQPLSGEAGEANDAALRAEADAMRSDTLVKLSIGQNVDKIQPTDALMLSLSLDTKAVDPEQLKKQYISTIVNLLLPDYRTTYDAMTGYDTDREPKTYVSSHRTALSEADIEENNRNRAALSDLLHGGAKPTTSTDANPEPTVPLHDGHEDPKW